MSNFRGLSDYKKEDSDEEEEKRQQYFAGGLDQRGGGSGLNVVGPPRRGGPNILDHIVQQAASNQAEAPAGPREGAQRITIALYRNGFVVNDGPLRDPTTPENKEFLEHLVKGEIPAEFTRGSKGALDVDLKDNRHEDYAPPPTPSYVAFSGPAATLGASAPTGAVVFHPETLATLPVMAPGGEETTLQVRTVDGKRLKIRISTAASVRQLAAMIHRESPSASPFSLNSGFPPKDLCDGEQTIKDAGLLGAAVTMKKA